MLGPSGRFLYTRAYVDKVTRPAQTACILGCGRDIHARHCRVLTVQQALADAGLVTETFVQYSPRVERGQPVPGFLYVVRKKRDAQI